MNKPITVQFTYKVERDPLYWALPVSVELRADVSFSHYGQPTVEPRDVAVWQDALGDEVVFGGARSPAWEGADEAAVDRAVELLSEQATREMAAMSRAS